MPKTRPPSKSNTPTRRGPNVVNDKYRGTPEYDRAKAELILAAKYMGVWSYRGISTILGGITGNQLGREAGLLLGAIAEDEFRAGRPLLSCVMATTKGRNDPGKGFFPLARTLGLLADGQDEAAFLEKERKATYKTWSAS